MKRSWKYYNKKPYSKKFRRKWIEDDRYALEHVNSNGYEIPKYERQPIDNEYQFYSQSHLGRPQNPFISEQEAYHRQQALEERMVTEAEERNRNLEFPPWPEDYKRRDYKKGDEVQHEVENDERRWYKLSKSKIPGMAVMEPKERRSVESSDMTVERPFNRLIVDELPIPLQDPNVKGGVPVDWMDIPNRDMNAVGQKMTKYGIRINTRDKALRYPIARFNKLQKEFNQLSTQVKKDRAAANRIWYNQIKPMAADLSTLSNKVDQWPTELSQKIFDVFYIPMDQRMKKFEDSYKSSVESIVKRYNEMGIKVRNVEKLLEYQRRENVDSLVATNRRITDIDKQVSRLKDDAEDMKDRTTLMGYELDGVEKYIKDEGQKVDERFKKNERKLETHGKFHKEYNKLFKLYGDRQKRNESVIASVKEDQERTRREIERWLNIESPERDKRIADLQRQLDKSNAYLESMNENFETAMNNVERYKEEQRRRIIEMREEVLIELESEKKQREELIREQSDKINELKEYLKSKQLSAVEKDDVKRLIDEVESQNQYENFVNSEVYGKLTELIKSGKDESVIEMKNYADAMMVPVVDMVNRFDALVGEGGRLERLGTFVQTVDEAVKEIRKQYNEISVTKADVSRLQKTEDRLNSLNDALKMFMGVQGEVTPQQLNEVANTYNVVINDIAKIVPELNDKLIRLQGLTGNALNEISQQFHQRFYNVDFDREQIKREMYQVSQVMEGLGQVTNQMIRQIDGQSMGVFENQKEIRQLYSLMQGIMGEMEVENNAALFNNQRLVALEGVLLDTRRMAEQGRINGEEFRKQLELGIEELKGIKNDVKKGKKMFNDMAKQKFDEVNSTNPSYSPEFLERLSGVMLSNEPRPKMITGTTISDVYSDVKGDAKKPMRFITAKELKGNKVVVPEKKKKSVRKEYDTVVSIKEDKGKVEETYIIPNEERVRTVKRVKKFPFAFESRDTRVPEYDEFAEKEQNDPASIIKNGRPISSYEKYMIKTLGLTEPYERSKHVQGVWQRAMDRREQKLAEAKRLAMKTVESRNTFRSSVDGQSTHVDAVESGPINVDDPEEKKKRNFK